MRLAYPIRYPLSVAPHSLPSFSFFAHKPLSHSSLRTLVSTMAESAENFSSNAAIIADEDVKFGFQRPEMYTSNLNGTVDPYDRHLFLCYKTHESWPARVEGSDSDPLPKLLSGALKARKDDFNVKTRLTICEGGDGTELLDGDVLIFPVMIKYRGLKDSDVDGFVEDVLVNGKPWASGMQEVLTGSHVFVCAHSSRDRRCGVCGPALIEKFKEEIELRGLKDQVFVSACSHVGGHKYAGNLIIFSADSDGKISGHWYGYVAPNDVPDLLDQHIGKGKIIERLWRGQMGAYVEKAEKVDEQKLPNGNDLKNGEAEPQESNSEEKRESMASQGANGFSDSSAHVEETEKVDKQKLPNGNDLRNSKEEPEESNSEEKENVSSCCQGANGFSCCRDGSFEEKQEKKGPGRHSSWMGKWEQHEVLAGVAVLGAVATVAVAYNFYRRSK